MTAIAALLILLGLFGTIAPFIPGPPVALVGLFIYGISSDFQNVGPLALSVFASLTLLTILFDLFGPALAARGYKSTKYGVIGAIVGAILGIVVLGPLGAFAGPLLGAFIGEMIAPKAQVRTAVNAAWGAFVGLVLGTIFKISVTLAMAVYFIISLF